MVQLQHDFTDKCRVFRVQFFINGDRYFNGISYLIRSDRTSFEILCQELSRILIQFVSCWSHVISGVGVTSSLPYSLKFLFWIFPEKSPIRCSIYLRFQWSSYTEYKRFSRKYLLLLFIIKNICWSLLLSTVRKWHNHFRSIVNMFVSWWKIVKFVNGIYFTCCCNRSRNTIRSF